MTYPISFKFNWKYNKHSIKKKNIWIRIQTRGRKEIAKKLTMSQWQNRISISCNRTVLLYCNKISQPMWELAQTPPAWSSTPLRTCSYLWSMQVYKPRHTSSLRNLVKGGLGFEHIVSPTCFGRCTWKLFCFLFLIFLNFLFTWDIYQLFSFSRVLLGCSCLGHSL